jgi:two-component system, response regulator RegA
MPIVLLVEDDEVYRDALARALVRGGYEVRACAGVESAEQALLGCKADFAVVDLKLADGSGIDVVRAISRACPACRTFLLTGHGTVSAAVEAMRSGAVDVLEKPMSTHELVEAMRRAPVPTAPAATVPTLDELERVHIARVLAETGGNVTHAAQLLGLDRRTLQRKLQRFAP